MHTPVTLSIIIPSRSEENIGRMQVETELLFPQAQIIVVNDRYSRGKGWAVRQGLKEATGDLIAFVDGDMDIDPKMIKRLIPFIVDYDIVVGVKPISGLWHRRIITFLSRLYIAFCFKIKVDTQTGVKLFRRDALMEWYSNGWLFDLEILSLAKQRGFSMVECPIDCNINKRVKMISLWKTLKESITLWLELR